MTDNKKKKSDIISEYNKTFRDIPSVTVWNMIRHSFEKYGSSTAVSDGDRSITYSELDRISQDFSQKLKEAGAQRGNIVAVKSVKNIDTIAAVTGIFRAGCVYLPVHADYPEEKKKHILRNCNCRFAADGLNISRIEGYDPEKSDFYKYDNEEDSLAYIIYTSGSTGMPKGVAISNRSVCNTVIDINQRFGISHEERLMGLSALTFDLSVYDILGAFQSGSELALIRDQRDIGDILRTLGNRKITVWNSVPAIMEMTLTANDDKAEFESVRNILLSGDYIPVTLHEKIKKIFPNASVYSLGGATEGSIWSIYYPLEDIPEGSVRVPYGYPLANQTMTVRDENMNICPSGTEGEICIGGKGVALGYVGDPEKTEKSFVYTEEGRIYRTGDFGVMNPAGYMEFLGRKDRQIKINGYRIEMGETESALMKNENIRSAAVFVYCDSSTGNRVLAACCITDGSVNEEDIRNDLKKHLLDYMIPRLIIIADKIPLTSNGKTDVEELNRIVSEKYCECGEDEDFDEYEAETAEIWKEVLGLKAVSRKTDFFASGGDSLKAVRMFEIFRNKGMVKDSIAVSDIFEASDFGKLTQMMRSAYESAENYEMEEGEL